MKKFTTSIALLIILSCGTQKKAILDPYVGVYEMTVFEVPQIGDVPLKLIIKKDKDGYISELETNSEDPAASEYLWDIISTAINDGIIFIDATIANYDLNFELNVDKEDISGYMMDMFEVEGKKIK
ncbi:MAG: hypothetical protein VXY15_05505 [Bacteroidota bacterium]|nr:hypothetical protein [Bacteroidota bacterium]|tara:strand:+ start:195 stop:572 length:378 start_codon:yes stop_codon:yes gene_type:complete